MTIWAKSWSEIIEECTARLKFFQDRLNYNASQSSGRKYLRETYPKFIPPSPTRRSRTAACGAIVNGAAPLAALREDRIAGAGIDVFESEPVLAGHPYPIWKMWFFVRIR